MGNYLPGDGFIELCLAFLKFGTSNKTSKKQKKQKGILGPVTPTSAFNISVMCAANLCLEALIMAYFSNVYDAVCNYENAKS